MNGTAGSRPIEILLVEDNPADADLTTELLEEAKVLNNVSVVRDGVEALAFLRREAPFGHAPRPDLILLDLNMPRMNGREVLSCIRGDPALMHIPVVVLTTSGAEEDILEAYRLHASAYVTKPVDLNQFLAVVEAIDGFWLAVVRFAHR